MAWDLREYGTLDSTNEEARRLLAAGEGPGLVVWARHQTAGKGRMGRAWHDLPGKSLTASVVLDHPDGFLAGTAVALAARAAVLRGSGKGPSFKWPNDLVYGGRKVGGILSERCGFGAGSLLVVGLGLNVGYRAEELTFEARMPATSLLVEEGREWEVGELLRDVLEELEARLRLERRELLVEYRAGLAFMGEEVSLNPPLAVLGKAAPSPTAGPLRGVMEGVDDYGRLLLRVGSEVLRVASGDVEALR